MSIPSLPRRSPCWGTADQHASTTWPWKTQALPDSTEIKPGLYEIRGGSTNVPAHTL